MPLLRPSRGRRRPVKRARTPTGPPVKPHEFLSSGVVDHHEIETCARCPFPASRLDVHTAPAVDPAAAEVSRRILGERE